MRSVLAKFVRWGLGLGRLIDSDASECILDHLSNLVLRLVIIAEVVRLLLSLCCFSLQQMIEGQRMRVCCNGLHTTTGFVIGVGRFLEENSSSFVSDLFTQGLPRG
jgi:hypothetical protein